MENCVQDMFFLGLKICVRLLCRLKTLNKQNHKKTYQNL